MLPCNAACACCLSSCFGHQVFILLLSPGVPSVHRGALPYACCLSSCFGRKFAISRLSPGVPLVYPPPPPPLRRLFEFLESNEITTPVIHHLLFPDGIAK